MSRGALLGGAGPASGRERRVRGRNVRCWGAVQRRRATLQDSTARVAHDFSMVAREFDIWRIPLRDSGCRVTQAGTGSTPCAYMGAFTAPGKYGTRPESMSGRAAGEARARAITLRSRTRLLERALGPRDPARGRGARG